MGVLDENDFDQISKHAAQHGADVKEYHDGVKVTYAIGPKHRKTIIRLPCDPDADPEIRKTSFPVAEDPILTYNIIFPSPHACKLSFSKKSIKLPSVSHITHSKSHFFSLMVLFGVILYCCAGCYYKREKMGAQGIEAIPHIDAITGCVDTCKGCFSSESAVG